MKYSEEALKLVAAKKTDYIKTNAQFWKIFSSPYKMEEILNNNEVRKEYQNMRSKLESIENNKYTQGIICAYDEEFPLINSNVKNLSEKPYLLFYRGDLSLLKNLNKNVAVIGLSDTDEEIERRESYIIKKLVEENLVIVSGLALGCDTVAHIECLKNSGKTIAILPTSLNKIYPSENKKLVEKILEDGGLVVSEYYDEPKSRFEAISRFVERDRLQAMFSKAVILIASYRKNDGDCGSRHAMKAAEKYGIEKFVMYNPKTDKSNPKFGLNKDYIESGNAKILLPKYVIYIKNIKNEALIEMKKEKIFIEQMKLI